MFSKDNRKKINGMALAYNNNNKSVMGKIWNFIVKTFVIYQTEMQNYFEIFLTHKYKENTLMHILKSSKNREKIMSSL